MPINFIFQSKLSITGYTILDTSKVSNCILSIAVMVVFVAHLALPGIALGKGYLNGWEGLLYTLTSDSETSGTLTLG